MAIIIPSKNIYDLQSTPIKKNIIDMLEVENTTIILKNEYNSIVYSGDISSFKTVANVKKTNNASTSGGSFNPQVYSEADNIINARLDFWVATITIPKVQYDKRILSISRDFATKNEYGYYDDRAINYTVYYKTKEYDTAGKLPVQIINPIGNTYRPAPELATPTDITFSNEVLSDTTYSGNSILTEEQEKEQKIVYSYNGSFTSTKGDNTTIESIATVTFEFFAIKDKVTITENKDEYIINIRILCGTDWYYLYNKYNEYGDYENADIYDSSTNTAIPRNLTGKGYSIVPLSLDLSIYGDYISVNFENNVVKIGSGTNVFEISGNEILQSSNEPTPQSQYSNILTNYKNGKETAVIRCSISDYKDDSGVKVIDITTADKMCFDIGDEVIPMVYTANGVDMPMSTDRAGNAKVFIVVGKKPYYDGAVWQELTLQEKTN